MKLWKEHLAQAIVDEWNSDSEIDFPPCGKTDRAVKFSTVAIAEGFSHIDRHDIEDVAKQVKKIAPQLRAYRIVADPENIKATESAWSTLYFTDLELD